MTKHQAQINEAIFRVTGVGIADLAGLQALIRGHLHAVQAETREAVAAQLDRVREDCESRDTGDMPRWGFIEWLKQQAAAIREGS